MKPWQEVDSEIFVRIFDYYWNESPPTILEIQNITSLRNKTPDVRAFIGYPCNPQDWLPWNKENLKTLVPPEMLSDFLEKSIIGFCILEDGPRIAPFGSTPSHHDIILGNIFKIPGIGDKEIKSSLCFWYEKDEKRMYRVRSWEPIEWTTAIYEYIGNSYIFPDRYKKDDLVL